MGNASRFYREIVSKSSLKWFPHSQYMISLLLIRGIPIESLYQQFPAIFTMEIRVQRFQNYRDCGCIFNPRKFEIPALRFSRKDPGNPCKHLQCTVYQDGHGRNESRQSSNTMKAYANGSILRQYFFDKNYFHLLLGLRSFKKSEQ